MDNIGTYNLTKLFIYCRFIVAALVTLVVDKQAYRGGWGQGTCWYELKTLLDVGDMYGSKHNKYNGDKET